jgi:hypothetical protein
MSDESRPAQGTASEGGRGSSTADGSDLRPPLTPEHRAFLNDHAVADDVIDRHGVYSVTDVADLPEPFAWAGEAVVPGIVFPWLTLDGETVPQYRPDVPLVVNGEALKYLWPKGCGSVVGVIREDPDSDLVLFVEGWKGGAAAASCLERGSIYVVAGCRNWSTAGVPVADLSVVEDKHVVVIFDGDLSINLAVWQAADKFGRALRPEGAADVKFVVLPASGKAGLDDVLARRKPERRGTYLANLLDGATAKLPTKPPAKSVKPQPIAAPADRPLIEVNGDRLTVVTALTTALKRWDGTRLFCYGGVLAELKPPAAVDPVLRDRFHSIVANLATCVTTSAKGEASYTWPDHQTEGAVLSSAGEFAPLDRVSRAPFVRSDGTVCQHSGYDPESRTFLALDDGLESLAVPDEPTPEDVAAAVSLLRDEWLGDFMPSLPTPADRANLLGLFLTPLIRGLVELAPLAVIDGLQPGVGKNLAADLLSILATGRPAQPLPYTRDDDETRKVITSAFRKGDELFIFDEAHVVEGGSLARALTSITYQDRVLGVSTIAEFPNRITWTALGNNVRVNGDVARRVFRIRLAPKAANPADRPESDFRHPDLRAWTREHRGELLRAALVLVRAWFAAGKPAPAVPVAFGSFEQWAKTVGGILAHAGVEGFLGNLVEWRSETDLDRAYWSAHLQWLADTFGVGATFTTADVTRKLQTARDPEPPPGLNDPTVKGYSRDLGAAYGNRAGRVIDGLILRRSEGVAHGKVRRWSLEQAPEAEGSEVSEVSPPPTCMDFFLPENGKGERGITGEGADGVPPIPPIPPDPSPVTEPAIACPFCGRPMVIDAHGSMVDVVCLELDCPGWPDVSEDFPDQPSYPFCVSVEPLVVDCPDCGELPIEHCRFDGQGRPDQWHSGRIVAVTNRRMVAK